MKRLVLATCALGALVVLANFGRSGDDKDLRAIINKAVEAHGGAAKLAKLSAETMKGNGKFYGLGEAVDFTMEIAAQDKQFRFAMDMKVMGFDLKIISVVNGDKGWTKVNDDIKAMPADELAEHKEQMHTDKVSRLLPLKSKDYKLSSIGEVKVGDQPAVGVRVSREGRRDVNLFFDKAGGHLVKSEYIIKDIMAGGKEVTQANFYSDYKEFEGTRHPTRMIIERDGKKFTEIQMTEIQVLEKLDDSTFERPQ
jgi:hypothetical protein